MTTDHLRGPTPTGRQWGWSDANGGGASVWCARVCVERVEKELCMNV
jgi:hypothetical protein